MKNQNALLLSLLGGVGTIASGYALFILTSLSTQFGRMHDDVIRIKEHLHMSLVVPPGKAPSLAEPLLLDPDAVLRFERGFKKGESDAR